MGQACCPGADGCKQGCCAAGQCKLDAYATKILEKNPAAYFRLGDDAGLAAADSSGFKRKGVYYTSGVLLGQLGAIGSCDTAVKLDGQTGYVDFQDVLDPFSSKGSGYSVELWVRFIKSPVNGSELLWSKHDPVEKVGVYLERRTDGKLALVVQSSATDIDSAVAVTPPLSGEWLHVVATLGGNRLRLYVNGKLEGSRTGAAFPKLPSMVNHLLGRRWNGGAETPAFFDEVAIYTEELQTSTIMEHFNAR